MFEGIDFESVSTIIWLNVGTVVTTYVFLGQYFSCIVTSVIVDGNRNNRNKNSAFHKSRTTFIAYGWIEYTSPPTKVKMESSHGTKWSTGIPFERQTISKSSTLATLEFWPKSANSTAQLWLAWRHSTVIRVLPITFSWQLFLSNTTKTQNTPVNENWENVPYRENVKFYITLKIDYM
jgi:hypothetical protein